jgi:hypothetical protein
MHQAAIQSLGIVGSKIKGKGLEEKSTRWKENHKEEFRHNFTDNECSESSEEE